ncbi:MAG: uroporphyrinogen decarboxylase family protein [Eubacteriaceae bacterium]
MVMSVKENFMETLKHGKPERFVKGWEAFGLIMDPLNSWFKPVGPGQKGKDQFGVFYEWGEHEPGCMPIVNDETKLCPDITEWRDYVKMPDVEGADIDWTEAKKEAQEIRDRGQLVMVGVFTGLFETSHFMMGFEDALCNILMEPDDMEEFLDFILEFKRRFLKVLLDNLEPDIVMFHDDWGSHDKLFMSPDTWREFFKPRAKILYQDAKDRGCLIMHHADSYCENIVEDMPEIGIDIWQGVLPQNDIPKMQKQIDGKMLLMGGLDSAIVDRADSSDEEIHEEVQRALREYGPGGNFIPALTYGLDWCITPGLKEKINEEIGKGDQYFPTEK